MVFIVHPVSLDRWVVYLVDVDRLVVVEVRELHPGGGLRRVRGGMTQADGQARRKSRPPLVASARPSCQAAWPSVGSAGSGPRAGHGRLGEREQFFERSCAALSRASRCSFKYRAVTSCRDAFQSGPERDAPRAT